MNKPIYHNLYYTSRWKALRLNQLSKAPLCCYCEKQGLIVAATIADHIKPHKGAHNLFFSPDNLQSLCKFCHDSHKQRLEKSGLVIGSDISGFPIDSASHWFKEG